MPELPDITLYIEALRERILGRRLERSRVLSPFLLRSVEPPIDAVNGAQRRRPSSGSANASRSASTTTSGSCFIS